MQYEKHKAARKILEDIDKNPDKYLIIHYSCESFYDITDGHTPRITSIAVFDYSSAQTDSFSMHKTAEKEHIAFEDIETHHDEIERTMLAEFFQYVKEHQNYIWLHWNMRDISYGFKAIEHRFSVLGGDPHKIPDEKKIDIARLLIDCYGVGYIDHPRMQKLIEYNSIKVKDYLSGHEEADAFAEKEYVKLHMSTLRKVDVFANILNRAINNTLRVKSKWYEIYGLSIQGVMSYLQNTWWIQVIWTIVSLVLGALLGVAFDRMI